VLWQVLLATLEVTPECGTIVAFTKHGQSRLILEPAAIHPHSDLGLSLEKFAEFCGEIQITLLIKYRIGLNI
jgi:hypothetical protein